MATKSQALITASVNGKSIGVWDTRAGGETTAPLSKYRPGGSQVEQIDAARPTTGDVTISRRFDLERDAALERSLRAQVGRGLITITEQPLDVDGVKYGKPTVYSGRIASVALDDADSNSDDTRMLTVVAMVKVPA